jgi:integrase
MASVVNDSGGRKRIQFTGHDGKRQTIRLGKMDRKSAQSFRLRVERLAGAKCAGERADTATLRWVGTLGDVMAAKLAAAGLIEPRQAADLGPWISKYLGEQESRLKPQSLRKLQQTAAKLVNFFGTTRAMRKVTAEDASKWRASLSDANLAEATVKIHSGNAKGIFAEAVRRKLIEENPFLHLASGATPCRNDRYVTPTEAAKVIESCPDIRFKLVFALARYAGLRTPSESFGLLWGDVNWATAILRVRSKKTERYAGHEERVVPITPELMSILQAAFDKAQPGETKLINLRESGYVADRMRAIVLASGVEPWRDLFQTLRRSCEIEWAQRYPQYAVSRWIGHSIAISGKHYANAVPDELYERVTGATQNAARQRAETDGKSVNVSAGTVRGDVQYALKMPCIPSIAARCKMGVEGLEPPTLRV